MIATPETTRTHALTPDEADRILKTDWSNEENFRGHLILALTSIARAYERAMDMQQEARDFMQQQKAAQERQQQELQNMLAGAGQPGGVPILSRRGGN